ncbi:MAG TPA: PilZ domain-containing protein [Burkholderiaceae bacterium]|jgi:c-di-GMP-binding flagellar brake protein YcgR|nr:PilZ domain-containing protein [Burkholderiaceae bacterium]
MRQFIRHPVDVPIELRTEQAGAAAEVHTHDISQGGLAVRSEVAVEPGALIQVRIAYVQPPFAAQARVAWCRRRPEGSYEVGVSFLDAEDAFLARMVEQVCYIEDYRKSMARLEGRLLSSEEAAQEWIAKYAAGFPGSGSDNLQ